MLANKLNLVMVDDDASIVRIVEHIVAQQLSDLFVGVTFTDPRAALEWINGHRCDLLISDVEMPGVGGLELLDACKRLHGDVHTILLTAHSSWERVAEAIEKGVNDYLLKPVEQSQLVYLLHQAHKRLTRSPAGVGAMLNGYAGHPAAAPMECGPGAPGLPLSLSHIPSGLRSNSVTGNGDQSPHRKWTLR